MKKHAYFFALAALLSVVVLGFGLVHLLSGPTGEISSDDAAPGGADAESPDAAALTIAGRPACPGDTVAGVRLDCLGPAGETRGKSADQGRTVVNVWAWWCGPCREELPVISELSAAHPELTVVGLHADADAAGGARLLSELGVQLSSFSDPRGEFQASTGLPAVVPVTLLLQEGRVEKVLPKAYRGLDELEQDLGLEG